jgi:hypothetical protein
MDNQLLQRIRRPSNVPGVIPGSTPVVSFGDFTSARVVTLSINPSSKEFLKGKKLLPMGEKRLVDREVLGISPQQDISESDAEKVWEGCKNYFDEEANPYSWFNDLEVILNHANHSYFNGSASHIDLVQSATFPAWASLSPNTKEELLKEDYQFFKYQTAVSSIGTILINGRQVYEVAKKTIGFELEIKDRITLKSGNRTIPTSVFTGFGPNKKKVIGWTGTLKSLRIAADERDDLYSQLGKRLSSFLD